MKEERQLFDAVLANNNFEHAIEEYMKARSEPEDEDDDIEFF